MLVDFINGDPDQPIISGAVLLADLCLHAHYLAKKTQSGIKTRSTKKAEPIIFNELRFEDKKGGELVLCSSRKRQTTLR
ncbi:bacteriophage T4 gp5 trimerization domain-containing protein (plasmid) [Pseudoalteromonas espejiana]